MRILFVIDGLPGGGVVGLGERATGEVALQFRHLVTVDGGVDGLAGGVGGLAAAQQRPAQGDEYEGSEKPGGNPESGHALFFGGVGVS